MKVQNQELPLFHLNAIPIVASELALEAAGEFKKGCVWLAYKDKKLPSETQVAQLAHRCKPPTLLILFSLLTLLTQHLEQKGYYGYTYIPLWASEELVLDGRTDRWMDGMDHIP